MKLNSKIYVAGHDGLVGSAIMRKLKSEGYENIVTRTFKELDLRRQEDVEKFFKKEKPEYVFLAAAKVGGINANDVYSAEFIYDNLMIESNVINSAHENDVKKLLFLGSSCIYPKHAPQPMKEKHLLTGKLEPTNEAYAIAKITGIKICYHYNKQYGTNYISVMPTNLYGPHDNFDLETSHVLPAMIRKFQDAKEAGHKAVNLWGTGSPKREFLHVDDVADAVFFVLGKSMDSHLYNIGTGKDISIKELAELIQKIMGHEGEIRWDTSKPDGTPRKLMDVSRMAKEGWEYSIP